MKRFFRWAFSLAAAAAALLFVATCVLWVRTCWRATLVVTTLESATPARVNSSSHEFRAARGGFYYQYATGHSLRRSFGDDPNPSRQWRWFDGDDRYIQNTYPHSPHAESVTPSPLNRIGIEWARRPWSSPSFQIDHYSVTVPCWLPALLFALPGLIRVRSFRNARRAARRSVTGVCAGCGYDLRATPGRCPECGAVPGRKAAT